LNRNEEEALNLLFVGDTNRIISSTPMNMASSRSHCIFTVHILACKVGEETVRKSKLNLVDLAGSERVWKTGVDGQVHTPSIFEEYVVSVNASKHAP
jgi:kinesin family protein 6/9